MEIRPATPDDAAAILAIYAPFVRDTAISFEEVVPSIPEMENRITTTLETHAYFIAQEAGEVIGYAYASPFKPRAAYRHTAEVSVYVSPAAHGRGVGRALYQRLFRALEKREFHALIALITQPNVASDGLHRSLGFEHSGTLRRVGNKGGNWYDVAFYEYHIPLEAEKTTD